MANFDAPDEKGNVTVLDPVNAKFQADYQQTMKSGDANIVQVAQDAPQQAQDQGGEGKIGVKELVGADPKELSTNLKTLQGLAGHFDKASDKGKAMGEVKAEVEKTIAAADKGQKDAMDTANTEMKTLKPKLEADQAALKAAAGPLQAAAQKIPEAKREHVQAEVQLMTDDQTSPAVKKAIEADLAQYPGLVPAVKTMVAAEQKAEPDLKALQALKQKVGEAAEDPIVARMVYADMLEQAGDKAGAKQAQAEAMALQMGMTIEQFRQLQQQQKK